MSQIQSEHDHLRVLIESMQRAGALEPDIHRAVRRAAADRPGTRRSRRVLRWLPVGRTRASA